MPGAHGPDSPRGGVAFLRHFTLRPRRVILRVGKARFSVAVLLLFTSAYLVYRLCFYDDFYLPARAPGRHLGSHAPPNGWWVEFFARLESTRITAPRIKIKDWDPAINWKPNTHATRPDLVKLRSDDEARYRESHTAFVDQLAQFASHLPYGANTTGIVTTAGVTNFGQVISLVLTTRRAGSRLPIQIYLDSTAPWVDLICSKTLPQYNATCLFMQDKWVGISVPTFERFQWKVLSILVSSFQNVLFLDADCLPILNPDTIFHQGSEPFTSAGLITWPDFWTSTASPLFYKVAGDIDIPPITSRATSESGILVYDKARHADTLLLAAYYNYNGPKHYYPLLSQHGAGEGDKETFLQAALVLEALRQKGVYQQPTAWMRSGAGVGLKKGYYDVKKPPVVHGRSARGKWTGMFLLQMDPMEDYRVVMAAINKVSKRDEAEAIVIEDFLTNSTFLDTLGDLKLGYHGHSMFFHHSGVKPDFTRILDEKWGLVKTDEAGRYVRMWGHIGWVIDTLGRDVEKLLWEDSMQVYCQEDLAQFKRLQDVCAKMRVIHDQLYA